jgi:uncharacterized protein
MHYRLILWMMCMFLCAGSALAKEPPARPSPPRLVNDFAGMLSTEEVNALEQKLVAYNDSTSTQIAVVVERTIEGEDIFDYSFRLAENWGIGQKEKDNGILIFIALEDRGLYIQTGYGVEGFLPDAIAKRIIENIIKPAFRAGQYYRGVDEATSAIMQLGAGEYVAELSDRSGSSGEGSLPLGWWVVITIFVLLYFYGRYHRRGGRDDDDDDGGYWRGGRYDMGPRSGGWMSFPSGGFGGGGGGGGGFGGFGGGSFGGGGAGGSW